MKEKLKFEDRLSEVMHRNGKMNAHQLSKHVGLSHVTIGNYLVGQPPKSAHLVDIARYFKVSTDWLLGLTGESMFDDKGGIRDDAPGPIMLNDKPAGDPDSDIWRRRAKVAEQELADLKNKIRALL